MAIDTEPRALSAALAQPAFVTRGHGVAMHTANRHVERWAPETTSHKVRSMRSLGFVDRMVAPWIETAQRSASLRLFSQYAQSGMGERTGGAVSWVFPRPWYQDELDWMTAAREASASTAVSPALLTTRGTYIPQPAMTVRPAMPAALHELVAPSLSIAQSAQSAQPPSVGYGGSENAYTSLVPLAAVQAAQLMAKTVAPLARQSVAANVVSPQVRTMLSAMLERAAISQAAPTRASASAPELVTPPAPRPEAIASSTPASRQASQSPWGSGAELGEAPMAPSIAHLAEQRARIVELQRIAQQSAQRELVAQAEARRSEVELTQRASRAAELRALEQARAASTPTAGERAPQTGTTAAEQAKLVEAARERAAAAQSAAERERIQLEQRIAQRLADRGGTRLHEQARSDAATHARTLETPAATAATPAAQPTAIAARRAPAEVVAAMTALPPELAALVGGAIGRQPERAVQAIAELNEQLRTIELLARSAASGATFEATRGPRLMMPAGLGGLVGAVDRATTTRTIGTRGTLDFGAALAAAAPTATATGATAISAATDPAAATAMARQAASISALAAARAQQLRVPSLPWLQTARARDGVMASSATVATSALGATLATPPAALGHVAWADRWLARFAGASPHSLDALGSTGARGSDAAAARMQLLANAAPGAVFVAPEQMFDRAAPAQLDTQAQHVHVDTQGRVQLDAQGRPIARSGIASQDNQRVMRFDDAAETPDDVFLAIAAAAGKGRVAASQPATPASSPEAAATGGGGGGVRMTLADMVAHAAPSAPGAGMSAQLAASPFAPALRHMLPMPASASFDVRALFGSDIAAGYLSGVIAPMVRNVDVAARMPTWTTWPVADQGSVDHIDRVAPSFEPTYVVPEAELAAFTQDPAVVAAIAADPTLAALAGNPAALAAALATRTSDSGTQLSAEMRAQAERIATAETARRIAEQRTELDAARAMPGAVDAARAMPGVAGADEPELHTLRSALLAWDRASIPGQIARFDFASGAPADPTLLAFDAAAASHFGSGLADPASYATASGAHPAARAMIEAMSLPMLGELASAAGTTQAAWASPGMIADRAQAWSVAQERSASDLSLDFVAPELVLAARVYGLGPAEAAQAARLAIAGPGQLTAMASTVDRTFVQAMAIELERRQRAAQGELAGPDGEIVGDGAVAAFARSAVAQRGAQLTTAFPLPAPDTARARAAADAAAELADAMRSGAALPGGAMPGAGALPGAPGALPGGAMSSAGALPGAAGAMLAGMPAALAAAMFGAGPGAGPGAAFGVDRRAPRGAFLWPSATVAALGMNAAAPDGQLSMSVAALELLAAQAVAELGTYAALSDPHGRGIVGDAQESAIDPITGAPIARASSASAAATTLAISPGGQPIAGGRVAIGPDGRPVAIGPDGQPLTAAARAGATGRAMRAIGAPGTTAEPAEADVLDAATALVPAARRSRFEALYLALGQSTVGRSWSPAARAARALALAGRGEDATISARERAASAWDVLPVVYANALGALDATTGATDAAAALDAETAAAMGMFVAPGTPSTGMRAARAAQRGGYVAPDGGFDVDVRPGLTALSARAGEALGSYVAPSTAPAAARGEAASAAASRDGGGAVMRAPTAAQEFVRTGRPTGRHGGGEVEIPSWFESAARKMLEDRSGTGDGISLAELTLVTAAPSSHVAASTRTAPAAAPLSPSSGASASQSNNTPQIDIEKLANEIYRQILVMMDSARARNGEPYL